VKRTALALTLILALSFSAVAGTQVDKVAKANPRPTEPLTPPVIEILSPDNNKTYASRNVTLAFIVREPDVPWNPCTDSNIEMVAYRLDGSDNIFLLLGYTYGKEQFFNYSLTLSSLSEGNHRLNVWATSRRGVLKDFIEKDSWITVYFNIDTISPVISVLSPKSITFNTTDIELNFALNESASWIGYSIDNEANVTITGNITLAGLPEGLHNITVYAKDTFGNTGASETITFTIARETEPFPTTWLIAAVVLVAFVGLGLLVYFKKRKH